MTQRVGIPHFDRQGHGLNRSVHHLFDVIQAELQLLLHVLAMGNIPKQRDVSLLFIPLGFHEMHFSHHGFAVAERYIQFGEFFRENKCSNV
jgi:hypothetical protein